MAPALTHFRDVVLRDGKLAPEIWGRVVWVVHCQHHHADRDGAIYIDFPGFNRFNLGFVCRLFGTENALEEMAEQLQPLADYGFISLKAIAPAPEEVSEYALVRRPKRRSPAQKKRSRKREAEKALKEGKPLPTYESEPLGERRKAGEHDIQMMSTSQHTRFKFRLARTVVSADEARNIANSPRSGVGYGVGIPVPIIHTQEEDA